MDDRHSSGAITVRPALPQDADGITRVYLESADYHAGIDPDRYRIPDAAAISARYHEGRQHPPGEEGESITLVAEFNGEIVGFVDARLARSPDPMHREMLYCYIVEIAVNASRQRQGVGQLLLQAAEDWGRQQCAELMMLEYLAANQRAEAFYKRHGYLPASIMAVKRL